MRHFMLSGSSATILSASRLYSRAWPLPQFGCRRAAGNVADVEDVLRMVEQPLRIIGIAANCLGRSGHRLPVQSQRAVQIAARVGDLAPSG